MVSLHKNKIFKKDRKTPKKNFFSDKSTFFLYFYVTIFYVIFLYYNKIKKNLTFKNKKKQKK